MTSQDIHKDKLIEKLLQKQGFEQVPEDFTKRIMEQVDPLPENVRDRLFSPLQWALIASAVVAAIITLFVLDVSFITRIFTIDLTRVRLSLDGTGFINTMNTFFGSLKMSPITIMSVAAVLLLLGLERIFRYRLNRSNMSLF